jgi:hypothetical protein
MKMSNQDLNWLSNQQPQRMGTDHGARERALLALLKHTSSQPRARRFSLPGPLQTPYFSVVAAGGVAAVTAALVLSAGAGVNSGARTAHLKLHTHPPLVGAHHSPLVRLADYVGASTAPTGDATLVARTTTNGSNSVTVYDLYADDGQYFFSPTESGLAGQVSAHDNLAGGLFAREVAAAKLAATGDVQAAAEDMAVAPDPNKTISPNQPVNTAADRAKEAATGDMQAAGSLYDNWVWENSQDALIAGSGQPDVRAGVLQILATLPGVTVTQGSSDGQPTLVLSAGAAELGSGYSEQLTINADSGVPLQFAGGAPGATPTALVNYQVSRVTLTNLPSGSGSSSGA